MIKLEIDVNVKGLEFLKDLMGSLNVSNGMSEIAIPADTAPVWTTNEVPKDEIPQAPTQPVTPPVPTPTAPVSEVAYTLEQLVNAAMSLVQSGKIQATDLTPILMNDFEVDRMSALTPDRFNDFALKLKELGAVI